MAERQNQNPGNFANDREKASRAGQAGGQHSSGTHGGGHGGSKAEHGTEDHKSGQKGSGNFADDRERAAEAGRKGGSR